MLGASLDTGNLGVTALASSTILLIKQHWPEAQVCILGGREFKKDRMEINGLPIEIETYPVRYCSNLLIKNHIWKLLTTIAFKHLIHYCPQEIKEQNKVIASQSPLTTTKTTLEVLLNADLICDITGGDSFSDIYKIRRFIKAYLLKRTSQMTGKPFIMLPQTYGPLKSPLSRWMAKRVLQKSHVLYSRDKEGLKVIESLIGKSEKIHLCPDVAFTLESKILLPNRQISLISKKKLKFDNDQFKTEKLQLIGLNISGLLYNGGYRGKNELGIKVEYQPLMREIIDYFVAINNTNILLVPHVVSEELKNENDLIACRKLRESLPETIRQRVVIAEPNQGQPFFDQCEIKYLIGCCNFFLGSRMHATIAAMSQYIPTIGLAYSKKFFGVYEIAGVEKCVVDLCKLTNKDAMSIIKMIYSNRELISIQLEKVIPEIKKQVHSIFEGM